MTSQLRIDYLHEHLDAIPDLARWHHAEWAAITPNVTIADRAARFRARAQRGGIPTAVVGVLGADVVGVACLAKSDIESHEHLTPWLASVLVAPEHRGYGIGSALCERIADEARACATKRLYLFTFDRQSLYGRLGWTHLEHTVYAGSPGTVMVRILDRA